jgi:hypothetical protein
MYSTEFSENYPDILRQLKAIYSSKILEIEKRYIFDEFHAPALRGSDFDAKPMVCCWGNIRWGKLRLLNFC